MAGNAYRVEHQGMGIQTKWRITEATLFTVLAGCVAFYVSLVPLRGGDFWLLAKIGALTLQSGSIPDTLLFPFTEIASDHFNAHEWLSAILFSVFLRYFENVQLTYLAAFLGVLLFALLVRMSWRNANRNLPLALFCAFMGLLAENYRHVLRPELLSLLVMGVFWLILEEFSYKPKPWHYPASFLLVALWANLHGSFPLAIVLAVIYTSAFAFDACRAGRSLRALACAPVKGFVFLTVLVSLGTLVNPFGLGLLQFAFQFGTHSNVHKYITEWLPTLSTYWVSFPFFWLILFFWAVLALSIVSTWKQMRTVDGLVFVFFTLIAMRAIRFPVYLCFLIAMYLPRAVVMWTAKLSTRVSAYSLLGLFMVVVVAICGSIGNPMGFRPLVDREFSKISPPMEAILRDPSRRGNVLNSMELGGELIYMAYPRMKPAMDERVDSYGEAYYQFVGNAVYRPEYFYDFIQRYDVKYIFLTLESFTGFKTLPYWMDGNWKLVYSDGYSALVERTSPSPVH